MKRHETAKKQRFISFLIIAFCMLFTGFFYCLLTHPSIDVWVGSFSYTTVFFLVLLFQLEYSRMRSELSDNTGTTCLRIAIAFCICTAVACFFYVQPPYLSLVILIPLIICSVSNPEIAATAGLYFSVVSAVLTGGSVYELGAYATMVICCVAWSRMLYKKSVCLLISMLLAASTILLPLIFLYLDNESLQIHSMILAAVNGAVVFLFAFLVYPVIYHSTFTETQIRLEQIMAPDFAVVRQLREKSNDNYQRALFFSTICEKAAGCLNLNVSLCAAGGFYYHIGEWDFLPKGESGIARAQQLRFPSDLIQILEEYYGIEQLPSRPESAVIHMVNALISKLKENRLSGQSATFDYSFWVYQVLNDLSRSGIYDRSGLSMNQFLKVREYLAKEELLIEFLS